MTPEQIREDFYFRLNELEGKPRARTEGNTQFWYRGDGTIQRSETTHSEFIAIRHYDKSGSIESAIVTPKALLKCSAC